MPDGTASDNAIWIVIPCYMSSRSLVDFVSECHEVLGTVAGFCGVLLVVDGADENTEDIARQAIRGRVNDRMIVLARNVGQHAATLAGIYSAGEGVIVTLDDDGQNDPSEALAMINMLRHEQVDVIYGISSGDEHARWRSFLSRTTKRAVSRTAGNSVTGVSSFRVLRSAPLLNAYPRVGAQPHLDSMIYWATSRCLSYEVRGRPRTEGVSTYGLSRLIRYGWSLVTTFSYVPLRLVTYLGLATGLLALGLLAFFTFSYFWDDQPVSGFTATAVLITGFAAIQFVALGVIGEYLARVHVASVDRPPFVVLEEKSGERRRGAYWNDGHQ